MGCGTRCEPLLIGACIAAEATPVAILAMLPTSSKAGAPAHQAMRQAKPLPLRSALKQTAHQASSSAPRAVTTPNALRQCAATTDVVGNGAAKPKARGVRAHVAADVGASARVARDAVITSDPANNVSDYIYEKMGENLHLQAAHPIGIIKQGGCMGHTSEGKVHREAM